VSESLWPDETAIEAKVVKDCLQSQWTEIRARMEK